MNIEFVEKLSLQEQFRLIEIAHETKDLEIKQAALDLLKNYLYPPAIQLSGVPHASPQI